MTPFVVSVAYVLIWRLCVLACGLVATRERNINECYKVRQVPDGSRWVIVRNDDYQQRICYQ